MKKKHKTKHYKKKIQTKQNALYESSLKIKINVLNKCAIDY